jgi:hypothetical protein
MFDIVRKLLLGVMFSVKHFKTGDEILFGGKRSKDELIASNDISLML